MDLRFKRIYCKKNENMISLNSTNANKAHQSIGICRTQNFLHMCRYIYKSCKSNDCNKIFEALSELKN